MKRFLAFKGIEYEAHGGTDDLVGDFRSFEDAVAGIGELGPYQWAEVLDTETGEVTRHGDFPSPHEDPPERPEMPVQGRPSEYRLREAVLGYAIAVEDLPDEGGVVVAGYTDNWENKIFEEAIRLFYGDRMGDFWKWHNHKVMRAER